MRLHGMPIRWHVVALLLIPAIVAVSASATGAMAKGPGPYSIQAQALLSATATDVTVDVSGPAVPAVLDKVHVIAGSAGAGSWNFQDVVASGGVATVQVPALERGGSIEVQVHVKNGPEYNLWTTAVVLRRPDVTVAGIDVPGDVVRTRPFDVGVRVTEANGDVAASAQVGLFDGASLTPLSSTTVSLTPGATASARLTVVLAQPGEHTLRAVVSHVTPAEWDVAPNEAVQNLYVNHYDANGVVASDQALATQVGVDVLRNGGNAIDAAAAVTFALNVTQPQLVNLGGGTNVIVRLKTGETFAIDARETAPAATTPTTYGGLTAAQIRPNGYAVGVPGTLAAVAYMLQHWGTMTLADTLQPAIGLADNGFAVGNNLAATSSSERGVFQPETKQIYLTPSGDPLPVGYWLRQPDLAKTFRLIAQDGPSVFYDGEIAQAIVAAQHRAAVPGREGLMTTADVAGYSVDVASPLSLDYRGYTVLGSRPSTNGGVVVLETLGIMRAFLADPRNAGYAWGYGTRNSLHVFLEAMRLALADRDMWLGDPRYSNVPAEQLLNPAYLLARSKLIDGEHAMCGTLTSPPPPGNPFASSALQLAAVQTDLGDEPEGGHTSHLSIIDRWGNAVVMTSTLADAFGSGITVPGYGIVLNDSLRWFNTTPHANAATGDPGANDAAGGKRPMGSMAPTLVLKDGEPFAGTGSYSAMFIPSVVLNVVLNLLEYNMPIQQAVAAPRLWTQFSSGDAAVNPGFQALIQPLRDMGHVAPPLGCAGNVARVPTGGSAIGSTGSFAVDLSTFTLSGGEDSARFPDAKTTIVTRP